MDVCVGVCVGTGGNVFEGSVVAVEMKLVGRDVIATDGERLTGDVDVSVSMTAEEQAERKAIHNRRITPLFIPSPSHPRRLYVFFF